MTDDPKLVAAFVESTPEMDELERKLATALSEHMDLGPIIHLALLSRMVGVVIASSTMELTDGVMTASSVSLQTTSRSSRLLSLRSPATTGGSLTTSSFILWSSSMRGKDEHP